MRHLDWLTLNNSVRARRLWSRFQNRLFRSGLGREEGSGSGGRGRPGRGMAGGGVEWETLAREHFEGAVYCMEPARLSVVFAYVPVHGTTQSRTFRAASFYIYKPPALAGVYV